MKVVPAPKVKPPGWPEAMIAIPPKLTSVPIQPQIVKRSSRKISASSAVRIGALLTMKLAAPALTVYCPERDVVERDARKATEKDAHGIRCRRARRPFP